MANHSTKTQATAPAPITVFLDVLRRIQAIDPEFPIQYAICLAHISLEEGLSLTSLADRAGLAMSTVSRIVGALSDYRQRGQPYGFVEVKISKEERRRKEIYLTSSGRAALKDFLKPLE